MENKKQVQPELFQEFSDSSRKKTIKGLFFQRPGQGHRSSYEYFVFLAIAFIIVSVMAFSLGVEKGRRSRQPKIIYTVQVSSYQQKIEAEKEARILQKKGFKPYMITSGTHYILCVGEFNKKTHAEEIFKRLRPAYKNCFIGKRQEEQ